MTETERAALMFRVLWRRGDRVVLDWTDDELTCLRAGDRGTVTFVDALGTVHVRWDSGSRLGLVPGFDRWHREGDAS